MLETSELMASKKSIKGGEWGQKLGKHRTQCGLGDEEGRVQLVMITMIMKSKEKVATSVTGRNKDQVQLGTGHP